MKVANEIQKLNDLLGDRLGRTPVGKGDDPIFKWCWSEDLFWPAFKTGRMVTKKVPAYLIGGDPDQIGQATFLPSSDPNIVFVDMVVPEYKKVKLSTKLKDQWVVTRWFPPEELPNWEHNFPQAGYPANGYRIHTNACLNPFVKPTLNDTEYFIECIKEQRSMPLEQRMDDMQREVDQKQKAKQKRIADEIDDLIPAFGNYAPGKRGHMVSMPSTQKELVIKP